MENNVYFVSGIDTDAGKSYATGYIAKVWNESGIRTVTQKFIQTGNEGISEDIALHRKIMGCGLLPEDEERLTMPEIFSYPCSPHLAAEIDGREIDFGKIESATDMLSERYDAVLLEGAGGLMVPTDHKRLTIDYVREHHYPLLLVTNGRLGSINQTLLNIEMCKYYDIPVASLIYNRYPHEDKAIEQNTLDYLHERYPELSILLLPEWTGRGRMDLGNLLE